MKVLQSFFCLLLLGASIQAQNPEGFMALPPGYELFRMDTSLRVFLDSSQKLTLTEVMDLRNNFIPFDSLDKAISPEVNVWAYLKIQNQSPDSLSLIWSTGHGDSMELYQFQDGKEVRHRYNGLMVHVPDRNIKVWNGDAFNIEIKPGEVRELYLKKHQTDEIRQTLSPYLMTNRNYATRFYTSAYRGSLIISCFLSILAIILIYNLIIGFSTKEALYFFYCLYLLSIGGTIYLENITSFFPKLGFPDPMWNLNTSFLLFNLISVSYLLFGRKFINSAQLTPRWDKGIKVLLSIRIIFALIAFTYVVSHYYITRTRSAPDLVFTIIMVIMGIEALFMLCYFVPLFKSKSTVAKFFIVGSSLLFLVGFVGFIIQKIFDINTFAYFLIGVILEILVFSLGLGYKFRKNQQDKLTAEKALNKELSKINTAFGRFVPYEFLDSLGHETVTQVKLGDQVEKEVTVFFSDIRGYTSLSEGMSPADNFRFLNAYLGRVGPIIKAENGFVNQYYGDGIMAIFMKKPSDSVKASIEIQETLSKYNEERKTKGRKAIKIGIGLHTGPLMMGIIGDQLRMDAAVVSDTVNTASRMEGLTKFYGADMILSETVVDLLNEDHPFQLRYLGKVLVKGRRQPLDIYECLDACKPKERFQKLQTLDDFEKGLKAYFEKDFGQSAKHFQSVVEKNTEDLAARFYLGKVKDYIEHGVEEQWNGVESMMYK
ncbi:MAG: hypothetical protein MRZ79_00195 [Bacteroidia bacterium]|nr:hypothetical protein [Bacteroidia bacterium]